MTGFALILACTLPLAAETIREPALLEAAFAPPTVSFQANKIVMGWHGNESDVVEQRVYFQPPNLWRHDIINPNGEVLRTAIQQGSTEWIFDPHSRTLLERDIRALREGALDGPALRALLRKNFRFKTLKAREIAGRRVEGIQILPVSNAGPRRTLWVDPHSGIVLRRRQTNFRGRQVRESRVVSLMLNVKHDPSLFDPKALGAQQRLHEKDRPRIESPEALAARGLNASLWVETLPLGFELDAMRRIDFEGTEVIHARYANGLAVLSLFASPIAIASDSLTTVEYPEEDIDFSASSWTGNVLTFGCGKLHCALVADLSTDALKKISSVFP